MVQDLVSPLLLSNCGKIHYFNNFQWHCLFILWYKPSPASISNFFTFCYFSLLPPPRTWWPALFSVCEFADFWVPHRSRIKLHLSLFSLANFTWHSLSVLYVSEFPSSLGLSNGALGPTPHFVCLSIMGTWIVSTFELVCIMLLWIWKIKKNPVRVPPLLLNV